MPQHHGRNVGPFTAGRLPVIGAFLALLIAGAHAANADQAPAKPSADLEATPVTKLKVGEIGEPIALIAAIEHGYFAQQKLEITLVPLSGGPALISATIGGSIDLNYGDVFSWVAALANGFKVEMIQPSNNSDAPSPVPGGAFTLLINPNSGIKSATDLQGKRIGTAPTQLMQLEAKLWLKNHGADPNSVKLVPVTPYLAMGPALAGKHVDAILNAEPYTQQSQRQFGFTVLGTPSQEVPAGASTAGYFATTAWLKTHDDVARRFVLAYRQAATWANAATPEEKAALWAKYSPVNLTALQKEVPGIVRNFHYSLFKDGPIDVDATQKWVDTAVEFGVLDKNVPIRDHLYPTATADTNELLRDRSSTTLRQ